MSEITPGRAVSRALNRDYVILYIGILFGWWLMDYTLFGPIFELELGVVSIEFGVLFNDVFFLIGFLLLMSCFVALLSFIAQDALGPEGV